ncbi:ventral spinal cord interneuron specification [Halocaridina rubra]|uniref:Ventral spinal cord interneuron specification n=1 Tax=Halocaridina rubra TaxID=373956 RepID=A0AAN8X238_HALRR
MSLGRILVLVDNSDLLATEDELPSEASVVSPGRIASPAMSPTSTSRATPPHHHHAPQTPPRILNHTSPLVSTQSSSQIPTSLSSTHIAAPSTSQHPTQTNLDQSPQESTLQETPPPSTSTPPAKAHLSTPTVTKGQHAGPPPPAPVVPVEVFQIGEASLNCQSPLGENRREEPGDYEGIDILMRIFPKERKGVLELVLSGCGGDLLRAIEHFLSVGEALRRPSNAAALPRLSENIARPPSPPKPSLGSAKSAFTPLNSGGLPPPAHQSNFLSPGLPRPPLYADSRFGPPILPISYPHLLPPLLPVLPPLPFHRHYHHDSSPDPADVRDPDTIRNRDHLQEAYALRHDLLIRPDLRLNLDLRPDLRLRSPTAEDSA